MASPVVTFDVGQTLVELDLDFLARRLAERGVTVAVGALADATAAAWRHYDRRTEEGVPHPWKAFMDALLEGAGVGVGGADVRAREALVDWLYAEQPAKNLWRKPIAPMVELLREVRGKGIKVAALSNSEGGLADLLAEIALAPLFDAIIDSQVVGVAKPDPRIFAITLEALREPAPPIAVHVGDSWAADVEGALAAGWHAIWYQSRSGKPQHDPRVPVTTTAADVRAALATFGV